MALSSALRSEDANMEPAFLHVIHNILRYGTPELGSCVITQKLYGKRKRHCSAYVAAVHCVPKRATDTFLNLAD